MPPADQLFQPYVVPLVEKLFLVMDMLCVVDFATVMPVMVFSIEPYFAIIVVVPIERVVARVVPSSHCTCALGITAVDKSEYVAVTIRPAGLNDSPAVYAVFVAVPVMFIAESALTLIVAVALTEGVLTLVAVMVVVPAESAVILPFSTDAIVGFDDVQVTSFDAFEGLTDAVRFTLSPTISVLCVEESVIDSASTLGSVTLSK